MGSTIHGSHVRDTRLTQSGTAVLTETLSRRAGTFVLTSVIRLPAPTVLWQGATARGS